MNRTNWDCPYCGSECRHGWIGLIFECRTDVRNKERHFRGTDCYKREIERLRSELMECYNVIPGPDRIDTLPILIHPGSVSNTIHAFITQQGSKLKQLESDRELANRPAQF